jgi:aspartyl-tRNA(Asn)/glutamyl-tRNA(Gln) amidotransferase subunit B
LLISQSSSASFFEEAVNLGGEPKSVSNWMNVELIRYLNEENKQFDESPVKPEHLVGLLKLIETGKISGKIAKTVLDEMYKTGKEADTIVEEKGLVQISDEADIEAIVNKVLEKNPEEIERFKAGEQKLIGFFVGQVMKETKGKANPKIVNELLKKKLGEL